MNALPLSHAIKEWAVVCRALASGRQAILLRKGGIAEDGDAFRTKHPRFWLYPTYAHEHRDGVKPEVLPELEKAESERPATGRVRVRLFAEVGADWEVRELMPLLMLNHLHVLSEDTVRKRFAYRAPGLCVLAVRVHRLQESVTLAEEPEYAGCRSWLDFRQPIATATAHPVLTDEEFASLVATIDAVLRETGLA